MAPGARRQRTELIERLYNGKLRIERRNGSPRLYASAYLQGRNVQKSTAEESLNVARKVATDWYLAQLDRIRMGENIHGRLFADAATAFLKHADEVQEVSEGQRRNYRQKWSLLQSHFDNVPLAAVDARFLMNLRAVRAKTVTKIGKPVTNATLKKDLDFVRLVLRYAKEWEKWIEEIPQFPSFRGRTWLVLSTPRPFLDHAQWRTVRTLAKRRAFENGLNPRTRRQRQELYCFLLICVGAALRVEEAHSLRWGDCRLMVLGDEVKTPAVHMRVFGKHSKQTGKREDAYALYDGVTGYKLLLSFRGDAKPNEPLFLENHRDGMRELLVASGLRVNADGISRDAKSLRQTAISLRLDLGPSPDYRDIAKWARTSVGEIGRFYDQTHPQGSVERVTGFRRKKPVGAKKREQERK